MLDGVTIIATEEAEIFNPLLLLPIGLVLWALMIALFVYTVGIDKYDQPAVKIGIGAVCLFMAVFYCWLIYEASSKDNHPERYQVVVSDEVNMTEFLERYKVVEQRGNSYIVEEKETNGE